MNSVILFIPDPVLDWILNYAPALAIFVVIGLSIIKFVMWLNNRFQEIIVTIDKMMEKQFTKIEKRFTEIEKRFTEIDKRFDQIDRRFGEIDNRFNDIQAQLGKINERLAVIEVRLDHQDEINAEQRAFNREQQQFNMKIISILNLGTPPMNVSP